MLEEIKYKIQKVQTGWAIFEDEDKIIDIPDEEYFTLYLYEKEYFSQKEVDELIFIVERKKALTTAKKINRFRNKSAKQIMQALQQKGFTESISNTVIEEMKEKNEIEEDYVIRRFLSDRMKIKPKSKKYLKFELIKKGFCQDVVEYIISEEEIDDRKTALDFAKRYRLKGKDDEHIIKKLSNKGFEYDAILEAVEKTRI